MGIFDQREWPIRFDWGPQGAAVLAPISDVVVVVDVLRFTTTVTTAVERGATVFPFRFKDITVFDFANRVGAEVAGMEGSSHSLSPLSVQSVGQQTRLVLPSPNGSEVSLGAAGLCGNVLAGCLRNAQAVAEAASSVGDSIAVIASGERWKSDGTLRPCVEDLLGAGAILTHLRGASSPEAGAAAAAFAAASSDLETALLLSASGRELQERGRAEDVGFAAELDASNAVPIIVGEAFVRWRR